MFEPLPFFNGKTLNYKQFFFYIFILVLISIIFLWGITDIALNVSLWMYRRNKKRINSDIDHFKDSKASNNINDSHVYGKSLEVNENMIKRCSEADDPQLEEVMKKINTTDTKKRNKKWNSLKVDQDEFEMGDVSNLGKIKPSSSVKNPEAYRKFIDEDEKNVQCDSYESNDDLLENPIFNLPSKKKSKIWIMYYFIVAFELSMIMFILLIWDSFNTFGIIYPGALSLILKTIVCYAISIGYTFRYSRLVEKTNLFVNPQISIIFKGIVLFVIIVAVFFINLGMMTLLKGMWISIHNSESNGMTIGSFTFTTAVSRYWAKSTCPKDKMPWLIYATLPEEAHKNVFITFHINKESWKENCDPKLKVTPLNNISEAMTSDLWTIHSVTKSEYKSPSHEYETRYVYSVLLNSLEVGRLYGLNVVQEGWEDTQVYTYRNFGDGNITIINGGDIGNNKISKKFNDNVLSQFDADVIFVGGDISYDNGFPEWYQWYDNVMLDLPYLKEDKENNVIRIIPVMFTVGNHDLGVNAYSGHKLKHDETQPIFKHFFPQNTNNSKEVPALKDRKSYFSHKIGDRILFLSLDTGYEAKIEGKQTDWLEEQLSSANYSLKFVQYHNPIYSAWDKGNKGEPAKKSKKNWVPLFDKYNVTMGLENHVHGFKVTYPIAGGEKDENGVVYIGDGSWGPLIHSCK